MEWVAVSAISTAVIAAVIVVVGLVVVRLLTELNRVAKRIEHVANLLDRDGRPALLSARTMVEDASKIVSAVKSEVDGMTEMSSDVRKRVVSLTQAVEERLGDMEALVDVIQYEVEETVLDVAAALRTTRRGASVFRKMKRAFLGRSR